MAIYEYPYTDFNEYNLDWCIKKMRDLITEWASVQEDWSNIETQFTDLKNYVMNYFADLNVQAEIDHKLDEMAADGSLGALIEPFLQDAIEGMPDLVTAWLTDHVDPDTGYVIDDTLSITLAAADAKATGDSDAEIRKEIKDVTGNSRIMTSAYMQGYAYKTSEPIDINTPVANSGVMCTYLACNPGDKFTVYRSTTAPSNYRTWAFIDVSGNVLKVSSTSALDFEVITAPADTTHVIFNVPKTTNINPTVTAIYVGEIIRKRIDRCENATDLVEYMKGEMHESVLGDYTTGYYWDSQTSVAVSTSYGSYCKFDAVDVSEGDEYYAYVESPHSTNTNVILLTDDDLTIIERYTGTRDTWNTFRFTIPAGVTKMLVTAQDASYAKRANVSKVIKTKLDANYVNSFRGCKVSLLGDSFSAFDGYSTSGHDYYPNPNSDVELLQEMWYKQVIDAFEMEILNIGGWSGSCVTSGVRDDTSYKPASDPSRCEALDSGGEDPDVIFVAMGVNDYSYSSSASQYVSWDGTTALGSAADLSDFINTDFERAYATMLARIQHAYPDAFIICITPFFQGRYSTDTKANYLNAIGKSIFDYAESVKKICSIMHVVCIDGTNIGFNRYNYYPTYAQDSAVHPTHPTIAGQKVIADAVIAAMRNIKKI